MGLICLFYITNGFILKDNWSLLPLSSFCILMLLLNYAACNVKMLICDLTIVCSPCALNKLPSSLMTRLQCYKKPPAIFPSNLSNSSINENKAFRSSSTTVSYSVILSDPSHCNHRLIVSTSRIAGRKQCIFVC